MLNVDFGSIFSDRWFEWLDSNTWIFRGN